VSRARSGVQPRRPTGAAKRRSILVFTEGSKTEPIYLTHWHRLYRERVIITVDHFHGTPLRIVEEAVATRTRDLREARAAAVAMPTTSTGASLISTNIRRLRRPSSLRQRTASTSLCPIRVSSCVPAALQGPASFHRPCSGAAQGGRDSRLWQSAHDSCTRPTRRPL
jgi:hypothetical protein